MRNKFLFGLLIFSVLIVSWQLTAKTFATPLYTGIYWIIGGVSGGPDNVDPNGRKIVLFKDIPANGFAYDISGTGGKSGTAAQYRINADEDERMNIVPGKYLIAIVKKDNYGMNPATVEVTGKGFDVFDVTLKYGEGIDDPGEHGSIFGPIWQDIRFGARKWQPAVYTGDTKFIISSQPKITAVVVSDYGPIIPDSIKMSSVTTGALQSSTTTYNIKAENIKAEGVSGPPYKVTITYDFVTAKEVAPLSTGDQAFTFSASNAFGATVEVVNATVGGADLIGTPITFPSPLRLTIDKQVTFQYTLGKDMDIDLYMFDISGRVTKKMVFTKGQEGGSAGINKPTWNLITDQGGLIASGIYLFNLVDHDSGKLLGKGKLTAVPQ